MGSRSSSRGSSRRRYWFGRRRSRALNESEIETPRSHKRRFQNHYEDHDEEIGVTQEEPEKQSIEEHEDEENDLAQEDPEKKSVEEDDDEGNDSEEDPEE